MAVDENTPLHFNGIDAVSGSYLFEPVSSAQLAEVAQGNTLDRASSEKGHFAELKFRADQQNTAHFGVKEGIDATKLEQAGWGVIFPAVLVGSEQAKEQDAIVEALSPLLTLRKAQATVLDERFYQEYRGLRGYRPGESKQKYLAGLGAGPGPADPSKVPYYLLIVGSPQVIPFHVQYQIDVQYAVGRIHFDTIEEYANYARSVVAAETGGLSLRRELAMVGVANPDDPATLLSRKNLVGPLADMAEGWSDVPGWSIGRYFDGDANKATVSQLLGGAKTPALLFTGSHGMGFPKGDPRQLRHQGALLLQDWPGPKQWKGPVSEDLYLSGDDIGSDAGLLGLIAFNFACYGAGTPEHDEFSRQAFKERKAIADQAFVAGLPRRMLGHPKGGALATIGHVERAWGCSFMWGTGPRRAQEAQLGVFQSTLKSLMKGMPVGMAIEYFNQRYAEIASDLSQQIEELDFNPDAVDAYTLANMWTSSNDARGYAVMGDPAVRLPLGEPGDEERGTRASIDVSSFGHPTMTRDSAPASSAPLPELSDATPTATAPEGTEYGFLSRTKKSDSNGEDANEGSIRDALQGFVAKLGNKISDALTDMSTLDVKTYVTTNMNEMTIEDGKVVGANLCAQTQIKLDGDTIVCLPERDGEIDQAVLKIHLSMVRQAQDVRAELMKTIVQAATGLVGFTK